MELKLSLPAYKSLPKTSVETRVKHVQEWLDALPLANSQDAGRKLADAVIALNGVKLGEEARCHLLECYRDTACKLFPALQQLYAGKSLPLSEKNLQAAALARELFAALADGYKLALMDLSARRANLGGHKITPLAMARAITCLGMLIEVFYETYSPVAPTLWSEIHRLYWYAVKLKVHTETLEAEEVTGSVNAAYTQVLLLALADPYRLSQAQFAEVKAFLAQFGQLAVLQPMEPTENKHGLFLVRLDDDHPPKALTHFQGVTDARTDILLNAIPLARQAHQLLQGLDAGSTPAQLGLAENAAQPGFREILKRMIKQWGVTPKRLFHRDPSEMEAQVCGGISAVHHILSAGETAHEPESHTLEVSDVLHATGSQSTYNCARWFIMNESAGGIALAQYPSSFTKMRVGDVVCMEAAQGGSWGVGLVRWMRSNAEGRVEVGAQLLAPSATPIALKPLIAAASALFQPALLLAELPALKQPALIVASRGSFQPMREFEVRSAGMVHLVRADKLIEQTDSVELFTFK